MKDVSSSAEHTAPSVDQEGVWRYLLAVELALLVTTSNFLILNEHRLFEWDAAIAVALLSASGAALSALYCWKNRYWRAALQGLLVFLAIDLIGNDLKVAAIISAVVPAFVIIKGRSLLVPASVFLAAMFASSLAGIGTTVAPFMVTRQMNRQPADPNRPAVLHIILDEHVGIAGLQDPVGDPATTRTRLKEAYVAMGFRVYDRAFSKHFHTVNALPWIVNFGQPSKSRSGKGGALIRQNRYFDLLDREGYRIKVSQTAFANFCASPHVATCTTYNQQSLSALRDYPLSVVDRSLIIHFKILDQSVILSSASGFADKLRAYLNSRRHDATQTTLKRRSRTNTFTGLAGFDRLIADLKNAQPGEVHFAHILLPHTPYVVRNDCEPRPYLEWEDRDTASPLELRQQQYLDQVWCVVGKVRDATKAMTQSPASGNFAVIIHGDHGSRLTKLDPIIENRGSYDDADLVAGFSTLFAIKANGVGSGSDPRPASIASLLDQFAKSDFKTAPTAQKLDPDLVVYLADENWKPSARDELPRAWAVPGPN